MSYKQLHFILLSVCLFSCLLMLADITVLPSYTQTENIIALKKSTPGNRITAFTNFSVLTDRKEYDITGGFYLVAEPGDEVSIRRSSITGARQQISFTKDDFSYTEKLGFTSQPIGIAFICVMALVTVAVLLFYHKLTYPPAKGNITLFLVLCVSLFLLIHLLLR